MSVAGMIPFETALKAVARQPALFRKNTPAGALIAVLAPEKIRTSSPLLSAVTEIAGFNAEAHCVLACLAGDTQRVLDELRRLDAPFQMLPVPFAFHSAWVEAARHDYLASVARLSFETPFWPVWSACFGKKIDTMDAGSSWRIVREPMQVRRTFAGLEAQGGANYIDLSPTGSLAAVLRQELSGETRSTITNVLSPFGGNLKRVESLCAVLAP
ncbi:hypothetical protein QW131_17465 [Roseibium salinum]|nr:hypothetical protein [Roseibium salinum]